MNDVADILEHLREGFLDEMPARVIKIEEEVMSSESSNSYTELFRMVHSLKGTAGSYNYHMLTKIAHGMEDTMEVLMKRGELGSKDTINILLQYVDIIRDTTESLISTNSSPLDNDERLDVLRAQVFQNIVNVLVVEPSKLYASMIEYSLEGISINFTFKDDGMTALDNLLLNKYDLLITSLECPRLNGDALVAALRLVHNFNRSIKVILVSSRIRDEIHQADEYDSILDRKSIKDGGLINIVKNLLSD